MVTQSCVTGTEACIKRVMGGHAVTVIGVDAQGRVIVSSWGQRLYVWPSDFGPFDLTYETVDYE